MAEIARHLCRLRGLIGAKIDMIRCTLKATVKKSTKKGFLSDLLFFHRNWFAIVKIAVVDAKDCVVSRVKILSTSWPNSCQNSYGTIKFKSNSEKVHEKTLFYRSLTFL